VALLAVHRSGDHLGARQLLTILLSPRAVAQGAGWRSLLSSLALTLLISHGAFSQITEATLQGHVSDTSNQVVAGAPVLAT
jgi:hypothetical protein